MACRGGGDGAHRSWRATRGRRDDTVAGPPWGRGHAWVRSGLFVDVTRRYRTQVAGHQPTIASTRRARQWSGETSAKPRPLRARRPKLKPSQPYVAGGSTARYSRPRRPPGRNLRALRPEDAAHRRRTGLCRSRLSPAGRLSERTAGTSKSLPPPRYDGFNVRDQTAQRCRAEERIVADTDQMVRRDQLHRQSSGARRSATAAAEVAAGRSSSATEARKPEGIWQSWRRACAENADHPRAAELFDRHTLPAFHDPFAGGGTLPLEAQRLGLEAHASDPGRASWRSGKIVECRASIPVSPPRLSS